MLLTGVWLMPELTAVIESHPMHPSWHSAPCLQSTDRTPLGPPEKYARRHRVAFTRPIGTDNTPGASTAQSPYNLL